MARAFRSRCGFKEFSFNKFSAVHLIEHEFPCSRSTNLIVKRKIDVHRTFSCGFNLMLGFEYVFIKKLKFFEIFDTNLRF